MPRCTIGCSMPKSLVKRVKTEKMDQFNGI
jgi:hypothetical protein